MHFSFVKLSKERQLALLNGMVEDFYICRLTFWCIGDKAILKILSVGGNPPGCNSEPPPNIFFPVFLKI